MRVSLREALLLLCFVFSGAASLMDQVVWLRYLSLIFGNTTLAAATLLSVFLGGLGLGAYLFGLLADRLRRPLTVYAGMEILLGLFAILSPRLLSLLDLAYVSVYQSWGSQPLVFALGRAALAALVLLPPTLLMGGTLPLVLRATARSNRVGVVTALFYALNTLGAVLGVAFSGFLTIRLLGLEATLLLAAALNLLAALGAAALSSPLPLTPRSPTRILGPPRRLLLVIFFLMGATSLAYEVLWTRVLVFFLGSSVYAYSLMLFLVLLGIGLGSAIMAPWADRTRNPLRLLALMEVGIALSLLLQLAGFFHLNRFLVFLARSLHASSFSELLLTQLLALVPILAPATLLMGASFPLAVRVYHREIHRLGAEVGKVYGANTLGSVLGSLLAGFLLIPLLGTQNSLVLVAMVNGALGLACALAIDGEGRRGPARLALAALLALALTLPFLPPNGVILAAGMFRHDQKDDLVYFHEDAQASVTIRRLQSQVGPYLSLELNGVNVAGTSPDLYAVQKMQGHLPLLLGSSVERVAHIGFGSGGTAWAVSQHPVQEIRIVEISPEVIAASHRFFSNINHGVLDDPRVQVEINDGRNHLLATSRTYDAVLSDSIHPRYSGNGSLYSLEYFQRLADRLAPGGVASMWLPMYSLTPRNYAMILKAFSEVFPYVAVWYEASAPNSFTIVTGSRDGKAPLSSSLERAFSHPRVARELTDLGIEGPAEVVACYLVGGEALRRWLSDVPPHEDDLPAVEYESGTVLLRGWTRLEIFTSLLTLRPDQPPDELLDGLSSDEQERTRRVYRARKRLLWDHRNHLHGLLMQEVLEQQAAAGAP